MLAVKLLRAELAQVREDLHAAHQAGVSAAAQRDELAARLATIEAAEPVAWDCEYRSGEQFLSRAADPMIDPDCMAAFPLIARPAPAAAPERAEKSAEWVARFEAGGPDDADSECDIPPLGWRCTRPAGHDGPCAAVAAPEDIELVERGMQRRRLQHRRLDCAPDH